LNDIGKANKIEETKAKKRALQEAAVDRHVPPDWRKQQSVADDLRACKAEKKEIRGVTTRGVARTPSACRHSEEQMEEEG